MKYADVTFYGIMGNDAHAHKPLIILILIKAYVITLMFSCMHDTTHILRSLNSIPDEWM